MLKLQKKIVKNSLRKFGGFSPVCFFCESCHDLLQNDLFRGSQAVHDFLQHISQHKTFAVMSSKKQAKLGVCQ